MLSFLYTLQQTDYSLKRVVLATQSCSTLCDPMDCHFPGFLSMEFFRQEYWVGMPFPSPRDLPNQESNSDLLHCRLVLYHLSHQESWLQYLFPNIFPCFLKSSVSWPDFIIPVVALCMSSCMFENVWFLPLLLSSDLIQNSWIIFPFLNICLRLLYCFLVLNVAIKKSKRRLIFSLSRWLFLNLAVW